MPKTRFTESKRPRPDQTAVAAIPLPPTGQVDWFDTDHPGFALRLSYGGARTWVHYYRLDGKLRRRRLGLWPTMDLPGAIKAYTADRDLLEAGGDPVGERERRKAEAVAERAAARTLRQAVEEYHRRYQVGEKGNVSAGAVLHDLLKAGGLRIDADGNETVVAPAWVNRRVDSITALEIGGLVGGIRDAGHNYAANLLFAHLRHFFKWCAKPDVGFVKTSPATGLTRPFAEPEARTRYYPPEEVAALWHAAGRLGIYEGAFLRVMLLTGKRKNALAAMRRDEIASDGWWKPASAKGLGKKLHMPIPLPKPARQILRDLPPFGENPFVFAGRIKGQHLDPGTPLQKKVQEASGVGDFYWHACRDTIATHMKDLRVPGNAARRFLDHAQTRDAHERSYTHDELIMVTEDAAETWGRWVKLVASRRIWATVYAHLEVGSLPDDDTRREERRARKREFVKLIQVGGTAWTRYIRDIVRGRG